MQCKEKKVSTLFIIGLFTTIMGFWIGGCQSGEDYERESTQQSLSTEKAANDKGVLRTGDYKLLSAPMPGEFWVSPQFDGEGRWVVYRGRGGRGVFLSNLEGGERTVVHPHIQGRLWWNNAHGFFCLRSAHGVEILRPGEGCLSPPTKQESLMVQRACGFQHRQEPYGVLVHDGRYGRIFNHSRRGTLHVAVGRDPPEAITTQGAWGVRADSSGRRVAYCSGSLKEPVLHVYDLLTAKMMRLGVGAHPAWTPDGKQLVFTRPTGYARMGRLTVVTAAELFVWDTESRHVAPLTFTPEIAEMQPQFSPEGKTLVFSDWRRGGIYMAEWKTGKRGAP